MTVMGWVGSQFLGWLVGLSLKKVAHVHVWFVLQNPESEVTLLQGSTQLDLDGRVKCGDQQGLHAHSQ